MYVINNVENHCRNTFSSHRLNPVALCLWLSVPNMSLFGQMYWINVWHSKKKTFKLLTVWIEKDALILMETQSFILVRVLFLCLCRAGGWQGRGWIWLQRGTREWLPSETTRASSFHSALSKNSFSRLVVARPYAPVCKIVPYLLVLPQVFLTPLSPARSCSAFPRRRLPPAEMNLEHLPVSVSVLGSTHLNLTILSTDWLLSYIT